jgi:2-dehydropantoate 2-reductase
MRILVIGAGAIGGYFGGRLLQANRDVTFLVRAGRSAQLKETGLVIRSAAAGDLHVSQPPTLLAGDLNEPFDLILLSCKAYDLGQAMESFAPAVGPHTSILPLLNGFAHIEMLESRFGARAVLGGLCAISVTLDPLGHILHLNDMHFLAFGERGGGSSDRTRAIHTQLSAARFEAQLSGNIVQSMWEKWTFIAAAAGATCLMRASVGDILEAGAGELPVRLYEECARIAAEAGCAVSPQYREQTIRIVTAAHSPFTASMLRDIEAGGRTEGDHVLGDMLQRRKSTLGQTPLLELAYRHVKAYEARRKRERGGVL